MKKILKTILASVLIISSAILIITSVSLILNNNTEKFDEYSDRIWGIPKYTTKKWFFRRPYVSRENFRNTWDCDPGYPIVSPVSAPKDYYCKRKDPAISDKDKALGKLDKNDIYDGKYYIKLTSFY